MNQKRIEELFTDYQRAVSRLEEALKEDATKQSIVIDGVIQRFEFTFELAWKLLKRVLEFQGVNASTPRAVVKEAFQANILEDGQGWIDMLEDRNKTSHIYDEKQAEGIYAKIKKKHCALLLTLQKDLQAKRLDWK